MAARPVLAAAPPDAVAALRAAAGRVPLPALPPGLRVPVVAHLDRGRLAGPELVAAHPVDAWVVRASS